MKPRSNRRKTKIMPDNLKTIIFDLDDTLFDRNKAQQEIVYVMMRKLPQVFKGLDKEMVVDAFYMSDEIGMREYYAGGSSDSIRIGRSKAFLDLLGLNETFAERITSIYVNSYPALKVPIDGAESVLRILDDDFQLGLISNGFPDVQYKKLRSLGIRNMFDCILLSEEIGIRKPNPRIFWRATRLLSKEPDECMYIGDSYSADVIGAKKAGMLACWFNPDGRSVPQTLIAPDYEIRSLKEVLRIVGYRG